MPVVKVERRDHVAIVTINRPEARNALSPEVVVRLASAWDELGADEDVRAIVLTGARPLFCAGADLKLLITLLNGARAPEDEWDHAVMDDRSMVQKGALRDHDVGKPLIAAVEGAALAGGFELATACDLRVAAAGARFALTEVQLGLVPLGGGTARLPRLIPRGVAAEMLLTGSPLPSERMHELGYVNRVTDPGAALDGALELAERIAANGPLAVAALREMLARGASMSLDDALELELELGLPVFATEDAREGPRAFTEKRAPQFRGR